MTDFFDEEGNKVIVEIENIKKMLLERAGLVTVEAVLLDQNHLGIFWKMVHLFFTRINKITYSVSFHKPRSDSHISTDARKTSKFCVCGD